MKDHSEARRTKAREVLKSAGYGESKLAAKAAHEPKTDKSKGRAKFASGGHVTGDAPKHRMDRKPRAHGGRNKHKEGKVSVNVINAGKQPVPVPVPGGGAGGPPMGGAPMAPHPPIAPPMGQPMPRPMGLRRGGAAVPKLTGGSGGGKARLEKAKAESKRKIVGK